MFSCKESVDVLQKFLDGELAEDEESHLREHFQACPPCVDFLRTYKATSGLCKRALAKQMPQELTDKLKDFLRAKVSAKSGKPSP
jgi:anti-sigma factor (TIGR02949 family)